MGFELDKLTRQYGLSSPTMAYSGSQMPIAPAALATGATAADTAARDALMTKYNADQSQYNADRTAYDAYKTQYQDRLAKTPMYGAAQFNTTFAPNAQTSAENATRNAYANIGRQNFGQGVNQIDAPGFDYWANQVRNGVIKPQDLQSAVSLASQQYQNANPTTDASLHLQRSQDLAKTGQYWKDVLQVPKYGAVNNKRIIDGVPPASTVVGGGGNDVVLPPVDIIDPEEPPVDIIEPWVPTNVVTEDIIDLPEVVETEKPLKKDVSYVQPYVDPNDEPPVFEPWVPNNDILGDGYNEYVPPIPAVVETPYVAPYVPKKDTSYFEPLASEPINYTGPTALEDLNSKYVEPTLKTGMVDVIPAAGNTNPESLTEPQYDADGKFIGFTEPYNPLTDTSTWYDTPAGSANDASTWYDSGSNNDYNDGWGYGKETNDGGFTSGIGGGLSKDYENYSNYAKGGSVKKRKFADGGLNDLGEKYFAAPEDTVASPFVQAEPTPLAAMQGAQPAGRPAPGNLDLVAMLQQYQPGGSSYAEDLKTARATSSKESEAFNKMLQEAAASRADTAPSKAEMYFRLASAFGAPTRTGQFAETLGNVGKVLGEHSKETREATRAGALARQGLMLQAQQAKMSGAKEDLSTLRGLASEEMKDKRTIAAELIKDYVNSGKPQSAAGKQAQDEGLPPGTPAFQKRVAEISNLNVEKATVQTQAALAGMGVAQANMLLAQNKFEMAKTQATKLTPGEMKLKEETENAVSAAESGMSALKKAYQLNPNTFDTSAPDMIQRKLLEAGGSKNPKLLATREQENLLTGGALAGLRAAFGGNPTEGERKILLDVQGIGAKSIEERAQILKNAFKAQQSAIQRQKKRLNEINQGLYRDTGSATEGIE